MTVLLRIFRLQHVVSTQQFTRSIQDFAEANEHRAGREFIAMAEAAPLSPAPVSPLPTDTSTESYFADSAIHMDMTTPTISPQSKPQFETDEFQSGLTTPSEAIDDRSEPSAHLEDHSPSLKELGVPNEAAEAGNNHLENTELTPKAFRKMGLREMGLREMHSDVETEDESELEPDQELVSHFSTTVSSLRLRHQEQSHLQSLFTSKLEALAQRSLDHEASIRSLTAELKSLRDSNTGLGCDNALLAHENNELRVAIQGMKGDVMERETAMEAMTGAVRGLEGWIESANNSPRSDSLGRFLQDRARHVRGRRDIIRGKGRFRGRYSIDDDHLDGVNAHPGLDGSIDMETTEIQEGVMAWVRGFKDVEEGLKARNDVDSGGKVGTHVNGLSLGHRSNNTTSNFDEEFGDFEAGG